MSALWSGRNGRERLLIVLCVAVCGVAAFLLLSPAVKQNKKLLPKAAARQKYESAVNQKLLMETETDRLKKEVERLTYTESPEEIVPKVIRNLQAKAKESGLHLREIKPLRARKAGGLLKVPMSVRFTAAEFGKSALAFLYHTEDPDSKIVIERLNVSAADPKSRTVDVEAQVALFTSGSGAADSSM